MVAKAKPHVFLSHVREDAERVERLAADLEARGIGTWIDRHQIKPGQRWQKAIEEAIRSGSFFVACFSKAYATRTRSYMNEELLIAIEEVRLRPGKAAWFIPIRLDDCEIPDRRIGPELSIRSFQWLDMFRDWAKSVDRLVEAIGPVPAVAQHSPRPRTLNGAAPPRLPSKTIAKTKPRPKFVLNEVSQIERAFPSFRNPGLAEIVVSGVPSDEVESLAEALREKILNIRQISTFSNEEAIRLSPPVGTTLRDLICL